MKTTKIILLIAAALIVSGCQQRRPNEVPKDWIASSDGKQAAAKDSDDTNAPEPTPAPELGETVDRIFTAQSQSLEKAEASSEIPVTVNPPQPQAQPQPQHWHMTAFMADLGISVNGLLGALVYKGTPSVTAIFRKQYPKADSTAEWQKAEAAAGSVAISPEMSTQELSLSVEPGIQAALATGRVENEGQFRTEALRAAQDFQSMTRALDSMNENLPWKVARFRLDLNVDVSGKVTPIVSLGGDLRLRFEWFRMKRPHQPSAPERKPAQESELNQNLVRFASAISNDLVELSDDSKLTDSGFKAFSYRVGLGISRKHKFGVVTDTNSLIGHLYFTRDVPKPVVNPKPPRDMPEEEENLALIDQSDQVTPLTHKRFRKGLSRAMKMGGFFARYANRHPDAKWKIYELRAGFDLSLTGKTTLSGVNGIGATEICFYNENF